MVLHLQGRCSRAIEYLVRYGVFIAREHRWKQCFLMLESGVVAGRGNLGLHDAPLGTQSLLEMTRNTRKIAKGRVRDCATRR